MTFYHWQAAAIAICVSLVGACAWAEPAAVEEVRQKVSAGQYPDALKLISKALTASRPGDDNPERFDLLMLKGECLLQIGQPASASGAFDMCAKSAPDVRGTAVARANALLVRGSPSGKYTPKTMGAQPIDILNTESRSKAFMALREDLTRAARPKLDRAMKSNTLPPIVEVLPTVLDIGYLEYAAQGSANETREQLKDLGSHARGLMQGELRRIGHQIDVLEDASNSTESYARRGLTSTERNALQQAAQYLKQIETTARDARRRAIELGFDGAAWEPIIADAGDQSDRAQAMMDITP